jgi:aspartyl-tRNA(Asn)/glutamyl-tRNA(Gln) amidotransferase subunit A
MSLSVQQAARALRSGEVTSRQLTNQALADIAALDGSLESFVLVDRTGSLAAADRADHYLASGGAVGPLAGIPVAIKDIIHMGGHPTRCGSPAYPEHPADRDATVVTRLREAGAVIVGKTTAHELACGVYTSPTSNPWDTDRVPGGSSGGSGAAVAAGLVPIALGSDTGGSIRIPAALCGIVGLKPTYGRVSRAGVEPLSWSLDHIGPLTATVADAAVTLDIIAGSDPADPTASQLPVPEHGSMLGAGVEGLRLGVLGGTPVEPMQPAVEDAFNFAVDQLVDLGAKIVRLEIPEFAHTLAAEFGIVAPEAAAYHRNLIRASPDLIDPGIRALLVAGLLLPAVHYLKALEARRVIAEAIRREFQANSLAALLTPTLPATAALKDQEEFDYNGVIESVTYSYVRTTAPFNLSGLPALSVPCGLDPAGLPIGLQIAGRPFNESMILRIGAAYEAATDWSRRKPPIHTDGKAA